MAVCINHEVGVEGARGASRSDGIKGTLEGGGLTSTTISVYSYYEGWPHMNQHIYCEVAAIGVSGDHTTGAKVCTVHKDGHSPVGGQGLGGRVTVLGGPEGLAMPVSRPSGLFSFRCTLGLKAG